MNINDVKAKANELKIKAREKATAAYNWCCENPEMAVAIGSMIFAGGKYLTKAAVKRSNIKAEEDVKNLYCYDRSLGHYWKLRRELRNDEWIEIDRRKRNGESLSDILYSMRVLE